MLSTIQWLSRSMKMNTVLCIQDNSIMGKKGGLCGGFTVGHIKRGTYTAYSIIVCLFILKSLMVFPLVSVGL